MPTVVKMATDAHMMSRARTVISITLALLPLRVMLIVGGLEIDNINSKKRNGPEQYAPDRIRS